MLEEQDREDAQVAAEGRRCLRCGEVTAGEELDEHGGLCGYCHHMTTKDD